MAKDCPLCGVSGARIIWSSEAVVALRDPDALPNEPALVFLRRHLADYFDATHREQTDVWAGVGAAKDYLDDKLQPDGYSVGFEIGGPAGTDSGHMHVRVTPRRYLDDVAPRIVVGGPEDQLLHDLAASLDTAERVDMAIAFVFLRGVTLLEERMVDVLRRGGRVRIVTGRYQDVTEPDALRRLIHLPLTAQSEPESLAVRAYRAQSARDTFHPKAYLTYGAHNRAWVGSSNLSESALVRGVEWNYRLVTPADVSNVSAAFEKLWAAAEPVTERWVRDYERTRRTPTRPESRHAEAVEEDAPLPIPEPRAGVQAEALLKLLQTRLAGHRAGLVILATGLGKTYLSAFDSLTFDRVLFIAHREQILTQAAKTYGRVRPRSKMGRFDGTTKDLDADVLFASIQTLSKESSLALFRPDHFDYIVVDEFHHAAAETYRRALDYFDPAFLLGLTATPDRVDGVNLLTLCDGNEVYRADIPRGIADQQLAPFHYFGIGDNVDYEPTPWHRYTDTNLTELVATKARADHCLRELRARTHGVIRGLGFCASKKHADFMREFCSVRGIKCASVHTGNSSDPRTKSLEQLDAGEIELLFCVDMFNEGLDVPTVDTILMLRPTQSGIVWLQQLGRGLRWVEGKTLTVLDFIGNHAIFLDRPGALLRALGIAGDGVATPWSVAEFKAALPSGVHVDYDLEAKNILEKLREASTRGGTKPERWYRAYRDTRGGRPSALAASEAGHYKELTKKHGSWFSFVAREGDLADDESVAMRALESFIADCGSLPTGKPLAFFVLAELIAHPDFPGAVAKRSILDRIEHRARRQPHLMRHLTSAETGSRGHGEQIEENGLEPLQALGGGAVFALRTASIDSPGLERLTPLSGLRRLLRELIELHLGIDQRAKSRSSMTLPPMVDDTGNTVNARFDVEEHDGRPHIVFHSRSGKDERNKEYRKGLELLLRRLKDQNHGIAWVALDSQLARGTKLEPLDLHGAAAEVAARIQSAASKSGRAPGAKGPGNPTKKLRIALEDVLPVGALWKYLWCGDDPPEKPAAARIGGRT